MSLRIPFQSADESSPDETTSTTGAPEEAAEVMSPIPGWNAPPPRASRPQDPIDDRATVTDPQEGDELGAESGSSSGGESSPAFTDDQLVGLADRVQIGTSVVAAVLMGGTGLLNERLSDGPDDETWLMGPHEVDTIATPLARIGARRVPMPGGSQASDMADLITAGAGLVGYLLRNLQERRLRRRALQGGTYAAPQPEPEPAAEPAAEPARDVTTSLLTNRAGGWGL